jgi:glycerol uptake facilitator-like aquaporin
MEYYPYLMEYMGVVVIVTAILFTDGSPTVVALSYFAVYTIFKESTGHFTPIGALAYYMAGRTNVKDLLMNLGVQIFGLISAVLFFKPLKTLMQELS